MVSRRHVKDEQQDERRYKLCVGQKHFFSRLYPVKINKQRLKRRPDALWWFSLLMVSSHMICLYGNISKTHLLNGVPAFAACTLLYAAPHVLIAFSAGRAWPLHWASCFPRGLICSTHAWKHSEKHKLLVFIRPILLVILRTDKVLSQ